ncbi:DsbA family oxidoreductase [Nocardioides marmorisolisilvae]|uniref:DsbA family oxidoreductase n=1 Tax=Nocardioides marmorisolisilvae TaxID=1542737 RepID=A0A3N0DYA5_9ACTN|nr:DsbA family oxidoreductase [Nocardioides marmorisolisilvae]RNL80476.1 DsbA family oxidoreductase [Nocardioides marmorisolisilvae]
MRIEIWSDVVCPWCYIGKRRLEAAIEQSGLPAEELEIVWRSFELDPSAPQEPVETVAEALGRKYGGGPEAGLGMVDRVQAVAAQEGMTWRHHESLRVRTVDAHRVLHLALEEGGPQLQGRLKEALLSAYFEQVANVADAATLTRIATEVGLDADRVRAVLASDEYADAVEADVREAVSLGATGVPFYVIDRTYGVPGAQPVETFVQVLERAWADSHPTLDLVAGGDVCGPDGCAV